MNLGQAVYLDRNHQVRYYDTLLTSVLAIEVLRVPLFAYLALRPPLHPQPPFHKIKKEKE